MNGKGLLSEPLSQIQPPKIVPVGGGQPAAESPQPHGILGGQASLDAYRLYLDGEPEDLEADEDEQLPLWMEDNEKRRAA